MKGLLLLSGGIDSPVAAWRMQQKGVELIAIHFSLEPFTDNSAELKSQAACKKLGIQKMFVLRHGNQHAEITKKCEHRFYYILTRRLMLRIAEQVAKQEGCDFLITGDNLGQVGSQTLPNITTISQAVTIPIHRPLLCNDKQEIIDTAREIDTFDLSVGPEMCSVLGPKHPATSSTVEKIEAEEERIDKKKMISEALSLLEIQEF